MYILDKIFGSSNDRKLGKIHPILNLVNDRENDVSHLSASELKDKTREFREKLKNGQSLDDILPEAFATVRETSKRTLGQRHYDVQILGGIILHQGKIAEMKTGEGKTLVATLPAYLNALAGHVHVVTVNDYLARRDAVWMGQIYDALGLTVSCINHDSSFIYDPLHFEEKKNETEKEKAEEKKDRELDKERDLLGSFKVVHEFLRPITRRAAYEADIVYGTNNEFGFDYLKDNLAYSEKGIVQGMGEKTNTGPYHFAIIDEVDSILIDESRTPLIISAPAGESGDLYVTFANIAAQMRETDDYVIDEKMKAITLTDAGINKAEKILGLGSIYTEGGVKYVHHLENAVRAKALYIKDKEYVVKGDEVIIVDEFTGRLQPGRRWSEGLHQAIEAKEGAKIQQESKTMATITLQNYFRMYKKLSGMTGTAMTSSEEFFSVYGLDVMAVPSNKPSKRADNDDLVFQTEDGKLRALTRKVKELTEKGQPVLIGTISIEKNEILSKYLEREGIKHHVLNAKHHEQEGEIIAGAGKKGSVVIATNMAGRGVDIKLGGTLATSEEREEITKLGGLFVIGTERHDARRIDNQLRGRSGRQGDPGETQFFVSLDDPLIRIFSGDTVKNMMGRFGIPEDEPIQNRMISRSIEGAQSKIEGVNFDSRKHLLEYDDVMNHQRKVIYEKRRSVMLDGNEYLAGFLDGIVAGDVQTLELISRAKAELGEERFFASLRTLCLQVIDMLWTEHLEVMDYMRTSIRLRAYGQRDPLVEYRKEALRLFKEVENAVADNILRLLPAIASQGQLKEEKVALNEIHESAASVGNSEEAQKEEIKSQEKSAAGRNEPCPCGSGKKYKKCHGR